MATSSEELTHWKRLWCWEGLGAGGKGDGRGWDGWMASPTQWTWVWVNSGRWRWTGRPGMLRFMGSQRVGHNWATELSWTEHVVNIQKICIWCLRFDRYCEIHEGYKANKTDIIPIIRSSNEVIKHWLSSENWIQHGGRYKRRGRGQKEIFYIESLQIYSWVSRNKNNLKQWLFPKLNFFQTAIKFFLIEQKRTFHPYQKISL